MDKIRIFITVLTVLAYLILSNIYIYEIPHDYISPESKKLLYNYLTAGTLIFYYINQYFDNEINKEFNRVCFYAVLSNFILIILTHHKILTNPISMFIGFNGLVFVVTTWIVFSGWRHGIFEN